MGNTLRQISYETYATVARNKTANTIQRNMTVLRAKDAEIHYGVYYGVSQAAGPEGHRRVLPHVGNSTINGKSQFAVNYGRT